MTGQMSPITSAIIISLITLIAIKINSMVTNNVEDMINFKLVLKISVVVAFVSYIVCSYNCIDIKDEIKMEWQ